MGASRFVGRVGGLAVALGVGAAAFSGAGVAWADTSDPGSESSGAAEASSSKDSAVSSRGRTAAAKAPAAAGTESRTRQQRNSRSGPPPKPSVPSVSDGPASVAIDTGPAPLPAVVAAAAVRQAAPAIVNRVISPVPAAAEVSAPAAIAAAVTEPAPEPVAAPADEVSAFLSDADNGLADGAGTDPIFPADSPLEWALLAFARRQPLNAAATASQAASVTASQEVSSNGLVVDPTVTFVDGVVQGNLQATSSRGLELTYTPVDGGCSAAGEALCGFGDNGGKITMGTVPLLGNTEQSFTILPYATWLDAGGVKGIEDFQVRVSEVTDFGKFLVSIPLIGLVAGPVIDLLQRLPLISDLLAPIIGASVVATVSVDVADLAPGDTPLAFTYDVTSFDGTPISTNFFPAAGIAPGETAPSVLNGPGLGAPGETDPYDQDGTFGSVPGVALMRDEGYNVITWDPRGEFASGGVLQLDNPFFEGRDASAIVSWAAENPLVELEPDSVDDPKVGMVGGSYGGGIQMVTASTDPRIDAIVPNGNWYSLIDALYPRDAVKTAWAGILLLDLVSAGARINNQIYAGVFTGLFGFLTETAQAVLVSSGPTSLLNQLQAPTLFYQGTVDALFPLDQSVLNSATITANPFDTPVKLAWFCGGHGSCSTGVSPTQQDQLYADTFAWLDQYVKEEGTPADDVPVFQWWDQDAVRYTSDLLPFEPGFNQLDPYSATGAGGTLGLIPFLGGSGPGSGVAFPLNLIFPTEASNAINVPLTPTAGDQIVGAAQVSFTYSGLGTSRALYAQFIDNSTGLVVGNNVTAIPVTLDGRERTVSVSLNDIAYTVGAGDSLTLQIVSWSSIFANAAFGVVDISDIEVDLPLRAALTVV